MLRYASVHKVKYVEIYLFIKYTNDFPQTVKLANRESLFFNLCLYQSYDYIEVMFISKRRLTINKNWNEELNSNLFEKKKSKKLFDYIANLKHT